MRKMIIIENTRKHNVHIVNKLKKVEARLAPGKNKVPLAAWENLKNEQNVEDRIEDDWLRECEMFDEEIDVSYYLGQHAARARKVARETSFDAPLFEQWIKLEKRKSVKDILIARLAEERDNGNDPDSE